MCSEFACKEGHIMHSRDRYCSICGGRVWTMDGRTNSSLLKEEKYFADHPEEDEKEEEEE